MPSIALCFKFTLTLLFIFYNFNIYFINLQMKFTPLNSNYKKMPALNMLAPFYLRERLSTLT